MKLISEYSNNSINYITESEHTNGKKTMYIEGIFAQAEKENRNNRIYPKENLVIAIDRYIEDYVNTNRAIGELNHADSPVANPERACILIKSLDWDGNDVYGKAKILNTPQGNIVKNLIKDGVQLGVSTRGVGSIREKGDVSIVENDYTIFAIDVVSNPSGIDCWVNGILENTDYYIKNGFLLESTLDNFKKHLKRNSMSEIKRDFAKFMKKIRI